MQHLKVVEYDCDSSLYQEELALREHALRRPLGLPLSDGDTLRDGDALHFGLLDGDRLVACLLALKASPEEAILHQMAVSERYRRKGLGSTLLAAAEEQLRAAGLKRLRLAARCSAAMFYRKQGYIELGEIFDSVSIPHRWMQKSLRPITMGTGPSP